MAKQKAESNENTESTQPKTPNPGQAQAEFVIQRLYVKDLSFEAPNVPEIFRAEWRPEVNLDIQTNSQKLDDVTHEVTLGLTVTVKTTEKTAFLVEVKQSGIFTIKGIEGEQLRHTLGSYCPNIIFPYAREVVSDTIVRGGFPQLNLAPINFDALYAQYQDQINKQQEKPRDE